MRETKVKRQTKKVLFRILSFKKAVKRKGSIIFDCGRDFLLLIGYGESKASWARTYWIVDMWQTVRVD